MQPGPCIMDRLLCLSNVLALLDDLSVVLFMLNIFTLKSSSQNTEVSPQSLKTVVLLPSAFQQSHTRINSTEWKRMVICIVHSATLGVRERPPGGV